MDASNLDHWEQLAAVHGTGNDRYYDLDSLIAGGTLMGSDEAHALELATNGVGVTGLDVLHLQCHIGCDAITMARDGARVTGADFSTTALARLRDLAQKCDVHVTTVETDSRDLPHDLDNSFDLVYATIGVLGWIDDIDAWMQSASRVLRKGGRLVLVELHPLLLMFDSIDPLVIDFPYNFDGPHYFSGEGSYANRDAEVTWSTTQFAHSVAEVVMASMRAGLRTAHLEEGTSMSFDPRGMGGEIGDDGRYRFRIGVGTKEGDPLTPAFPLPLLFTLIGEKS
jgi:ubiquinone/menaquinone biosynthesis C-methylase UbiE